MAEAAREYCDLVMKGGITSGLVYPKTAIELAKRYRFKNVGGTSAGAIAAAACAAAAIGERRKDLAAKSVGDPQSAGFAGLEIVAAELAKPGLIFSLFQPKTGAKSVYRLLVALPRLKSWVWLALPATLIWAGGLELVGALLLFGALLALAIWLTQASGILLLALSALAGALIIAAGAIAAWCGLNRIARTVRHNMLGICSGMRAHGERGPPALTEWLHGVIQKLSAQPAREPLCFEHLWKAPRYEGEPETARTLALQVITSGISHHEPRSLPIEKNGGRFWFLREEFDLLFPREVVDWMAAQDKAPVKSGGKTYYQLPPEGKLPVLVAARMSLSFPILISAVPLHEPDFRQIGGDEVEPARAEATPKRGAAAADQLTAGGARDREKIADATPFRVCWFSDGGISSNFPIHLFDSPLPRWPTFAIDLVYTDDPARQAPWLPTSNNQGWQRRYTAIASGNPLGDIAAFLFGIVGTMQNWRDLLLSRAPGQRERIVRVPLRPDEGGMNLDMPEPVLREISEKGAAAGTELVAKFDFDNHYWIRWRNVAATSEAFLNSFATGAQPPISASYSDAWSSATMGKPPAPSYRLTAGQKAEAQARFAELTRLGQSWGIATPSLVSGAPNPRPRLAITPIY